MPDWQTEAYVESYGPDAMAEEDICRAVGEDLTRAYPGHPWLVGCIGEAGTIVIDLGYEKPHAIRNMGWLLHIKSLHEAGGQAKVMRAGGELLERFGLAREEAVKESAVAAKENGFEASDNAEGAWALGKAQR